MIVPRIARRFAPELAPELARPRSRPRRAALALTLLSACAVACTPAPDGPARRVVWITCDTLRADRLGCYGNPRGLTPELDRFARAAVVYDEAYASAPMTLPSVSSMLTGRMPQEVGVDYDNHLHMPSEVETLAEVLADAGLETAAVVSNFVLRHFPRELGDCGVQQGFEHFDDRMTEGERNRDHLERRARDTTDAALAWLAAAPRDRFFLWVHYQDPHGPYDPLAEDLAALPPPQPSADGDALLSFSADRFGNGAIPAYQVLGDEQRPSVYRDRYDAEVRGFDREAGRLLRHLEQQRLLDDALIVFTADHGESLGEHDYWFCHGEHVYREVVRVPLLVRPPRGAAIAHDVERDGVRRVERVASLLDLRATTLAALGVAADAGRGLSLLGAGTPAGRLVGQAFFPEAGRARWSAVSDGRWRVVWTEGVGRQLFDVRADPDELVDRSAEDPERVRRMVAGQRAALREHAVPRVAGRPIEASEASTRALRALGYVDEE